MNTPTVAELLANQSPAVIEATREIAESGDTALLAAEIDRLTAEDDDLREHEPYERDTLENMTCDSRL